MMKSICISFLKVVANHEARPRRHSIHHPTCEKARQQGFAWNSVSASVPICAKSYLNLPLIIESHSVSKV